LAFVSHVIVNTFEVICACKTKTCRIARIVKELITRAHCRNQIDN